MNKLILIIDDNPTNLQLTSDILEYEGCRVITAADSRQARETLQNNMPDLILMDIALPGMDGLTLTRQLKMDESLCHIPVIALTAFAMKGDDRKALDAGCIGYITKPIDTRKFADQINQLLRKTEDPHGFANAPGERNDRDTR